MNRDWMIRRPSLLVSALTLVLAAMLLAGVASSSAQVTDETIGATTAVPVSSPRSRRLRSLSRGFSRR